MAAMAAIALALILIALKPSTRAPTNPPASYASYLISPPSSPLVFGWLLWIFCRLAASGVFLDIVGDVAVLTVLIVVTFVPLIVVIMLPYCPGMVVRPIPSPLHHARMFLVGCCMKKNQTAAI
jgi:hypothetical protein